MYRSNAYPKYSTLSLLIIMFMTSFSASSSAEKISVGAILSCDIPYYNEIHDSFVEGLKAEGYRADEIEIILQKPMPNPMSWMNSARKLVTLDVNVIISYGAPATLAAQSASSKIPVVYAGVYEPQRLGISAKNVTGISSGVPVASLLKTLNTIVKYSKLGIVYSGLERDTVIQAKKAVTLADKIHFTPEVIDIAKTEGAVDLSGLDALFMTSSCAGMRRIDDIVGLAQNAKIPIIASVGGAAEKGALLTISGNTQEQGSVISSMVAGILKGSKPSSIAPKMATDIEFVVNLRASNSLGLTLPFDPMTTATRVIE
jgi:putative ABC transport system substrate-binding protein